MIPLIWSLQSWDVSGTPDRPDGTPTLPPHGLIFRLSLPCVGTAAVYYNRVYLSPSLLPDVDDVVFLRNAVMCTGPMCGGPPERHNGATPASKPTPTSTSTSTPTPTSAAAATPDPATDTTGERVSGPPSNPIQYNSNRPCFCYPADRKRRPSSPIFFFSL